MHRDWKQTAYKTVLSHAQRGMKPEVVNFTASTTSLENVQDVGYFLFCSYVLKLTDCYEKMSILHFELLPDPISFHPSSWLLNEGCQVLLSRRTSVHCALCSLFPFYPNVAPNKSYGFIFIATKRNERNIFVYMRINPFVFPFY